MTELNGFGINDIKEKVERVEELVGELVAQCPADVDFVIGASAEVLDSETSREKYVTVSISGSEIFILQVIKSLIKQLKPANLFLLRHYIEEKL